MIGINISDYSVIVIFVEDFETVRSNKFYTEIYRIYIFFSEFIYVLLLSVRNRVKERTFMTILQGGVKIAFYCLWKRAG